MRKTVTVWQLLVNYGKGWENELEEDNYEEIQLRKKEYQENCPQYPTKIRCKKVKI